MHHFSIQIAAENIHVKINPYRKREPRHYGILFFCFSTISQADQLIIEVVKYVLYYKKGAHSTPLL